MTRSSRLGKHRHLPFLLLILVWVAASCGPGPATEVDFPVTTLLLVRHAEKAAQPADDPPLTPIGQERARELLRVVGATSIDAIYATDRIRTQQTVEPAAAAMGLPIRQRGMRDVDGLVAQILAHHRGQTLLVAGHGGTVPQIIEKLGGGSIPPLAESDYDNLFMVTLYGLGKARVVNLKYGRPT